MQNRKLAVLVVGLDRSGTSATARVLNRLGVHMHNPQGEYHNHPKHNPTGYYEDPHINTDLDHQIYDRRVADVVKSYDQHAVWGLKDPRLCWPRNLFGVIRQIRKWDPEREIRIVATLRPIECIKKSRERCGAEPDDGLLLHVSRLSTRAMYLLGKWGVVPKWCLIPYDGMVDYPHHTARFLKDWAELPGDVVEAAAAIDPKLRHHV